MLFHTLPYYKNLHLSDSRSCITLRLSFQENYHLCQPASWNPTIMFHLIILTIMKYKIKIYWEAQNYIHVSLFFMQRRTQKIAEEEKIRYISTCVYIHIYVTVIVLEIKLLSKEQALTNIKVRRNVIPRRQMRLFNIFICWKHLSGMKLSAIIHLCILSSLDKRRL